MYVCIYCLFNNEISIVEEYWSSADICECLHPLTLRYTKCPCAEKFSAHVALLKSSS